MINACRWLCRRCAVVTNDRLPVDECRLLAAEIDERDSLHFIDLERGLRFGDDTLRQHHLALRWISADHDTFVFEVKLFAGELSDETL